VGEAGVIRGVLFAAGPGSDHHESARLSWIGTYYDGEAIGKLIYIHRLDTIGVDALRLGQKSGQKGHP
jgi:hypothetical protein